MKKIIKESELRELISNKISQILRENMEEMQKELDAANDWFYSLTAYDKYSVFTEDGESGYDCFADGLAEWYGNIGWQHLSPEEYEEYLDESWDYTPDDDKVRLHNKFKGYIGPDEDDLKDIVAECIKRTLNEISPDMLYHASEKAYEKGRNIQGNKFHDEANSRMGQEYANDNIMKVSNKTIIYATDGCRVAISDNGNYFVNATSIQGTNEQGYLNSSVKIPSFMKTTDKTLARKIAKWCSQYLILDEPVKNSGAVCNDFSDWHTWCNL